MAQRLSIKVPDLKSVDVKDFWSGCFFCGVGIFYGAISLTGLPIGQVFNMGPGFFPLVLCALLLLIGGGLIARALSSKVGTTFGAMPWRAIAMVSAAVAAFALLLEPLGLLVAVFATTLIATFAAPRTRLLPTLLTAAAISAFCVAVFVFGAQLQAPVFGYWFGG